ncbi:hypothetical protein RvY_13217 [Ramazzottius varieornatus]|uniref:Major facilitator superfamily (MFS) profile domain-containing protein n=1 Tax=Ramazzottius varieornatus TaxID=947166 RepID=A0A1D1VP04_RAMVA|nr:hypothetical protein RvY_13217 [Ramazzottius varieornatus]
MEKPNSKSKLEIPEMEPEVESAAKPKPRYPWYIIFIIGNEFCERFSYYGMKTVLTLYFSKMLLWSEDTTTFFYHFFTMLCYFFPIFGAWIADGMIGKFKTILYLSLVYIVGLVVLTLSAIPPLHFHAVAGTLSGLLLIAIGTGGIKPCVAAYGADQFKPGQEVQRETFFSYFYFAINAGSLISTFATPILRSDVQCFGSKSCYSLAFGVPAILMAVALVLFLIGKPFYEDHLPTGSLISRVFLCISHAIANNCRGRGKPRLRDVYKKSDSYEVATQGKMGNFLTRFQNPFRRRTPNIYKPHWLDSAADKYDIAFINDVKQLLRVLVMFLPIPMFWALFDQQGSRWTLQANKMDGRVTDTYFFQPDQVQIFNPVLILILIPFFEWVFYPLLGKMKIPFRLLARMVVGMILAGAAFVIAGFVQIALDKTLPGVVPIGRAEIRIFNTNPCTLHLSGQLASALNESNAYLLAPFEMKMLPDVVVSGQVLQTLTVRNVNCTSPFPLTDVKVNLTETQVSSLFLSSYQGRLISRQFAVAKEKPEDGNAKVRFVVPFPLGSASGSDGHITLINPDIAQDKPGHEFVVPVQKNNATDQSDTGVLDDVTADIDQGWYDLHTSTEDAEKVSTTTKQQQLDLPNGGVYTIVLKQNASAGARMWERYVIVEPNTLSIFWQFPQYFVITVGEVFLSVSGLTFAYAEAPESMKSVLQAAWLLTSAFGSVIVMIFSGAHLIRSQAVEFFVFAGIIGVFALIFALMANTYHYKEKDGGSIEMADGLPALQPRGSSSSEAELIPEATADAEQFKR